MDERQISIAFQTDKTPARYIELAKWVDQYAFDVVTVYCDAPYHPAHSALLLMAPHIRHARIGAAAIPPARIHPIDIAANAALLEELAPGRTYIGLARGAWLGDVGIHEAEHPIQAIREAVEVIRYFLNGETGGYNGQVYSLAPHIRAPYPIPERLPPILIGTWGRKLCALAGEIADEVKVGGSTNPDIVPVIARYIADGERKEGRQTGSVGIVMGAVSVIDEDRQAAREAARRALVMYLPVCAPLDPTVQVEPDLISRLNDYTKSVAERACLISDDLLRRFAFAGNAHDIIDHAEALFAAGAQRVEFGTPHGLERAETGIRILGEQVIPALKRA